MRQSATTPKLTIGQAIAGLKGEFPDEDIRQSRLRFLEAEGLIKPERTPSGYRKFSTEDMDRLRYIITMQRQFHLPLKVIQEHLDAMERGLEPPPVYDGPTVPRSDGATTPGAETFRAPPADVRISRKELLKTAEITEDVLDQLETYGLVRMRSGAKHYDSDALQVARAAGELARFGMEPRHLRAFRTAADREIGLVEQVVSPIRRSREDGAAGRANQAMDEIAALSVHLHATLVRAGLRSLR
ncbi:transcriptional regulator FtsR [Nocardioides terrisoli]|uniref:transcriptional regulator FtsR n=1 Tax=Nocardioides terrisoli TaxID=3388267 RepID=UPI00287B99F9|nr:MerR family transcriptional regulator [Nocardioides marmorisolisilvae]